MARLNSQTIRKIFFSFLVSRISAFREREGGIFSSLSIEDEGEIVIMLLSKASLTTFNKLVCWKGGREGVKII